MPRGMEEMPYYTTSIRGDGDMVNKEPATDIGGIQVGIMRPDDIREMSAVHVTTHEELSSRMLQVRIYPL